MPVINKPTMDGTHSSRNTSGAKMESPKMISTAYGTGICRSKSLPSYLSVRPIERELSPCCRSRRI